MRYEVTQYIVEPSGYAKYKQGLDSLLVAGWKVESVTMDSNRVGQSHTSNVVVVVVLSKE